MRRGMVAAGVIVAAASIAAGLLLVARREGSVRQAPPSKPAGEVTVAYPEDPLSLNPLTFEGDTIASRDLLRPVLPTLLGADPDMKYRPALATDVPAGPDSGRNGFSVTFRIDPRAVWSDGVPITADDVRFTWETFARAELPIADRSAYRRIERVVSLSGGKVRLELDGPYASWRDLFSSGDFVLPMHSFAGKDFNSWFGPGMASGGPFLLEEYVPGLKLVYRANPRWWGRGPGFERVTLFIVPGIDTALRLLDDKRVDVVVATTQINLNARAATIKGARTASRFGSAWWELAFNTSHPGVGDVGFRRAVAASLDRQGFVEALIQQQGRGLESFMTGGFPALQGIAQGPEAASAALTTAGFKRNNAGRWTRSGVGVLDLSAPEGSEISAVVERSVFEALKRTGIPVEIVNPRAAVFYGRWRQEGKFDIAIWERRGTPSTDPTPAFRSDLAPPAGLNYYRLSSGGVDATIGGFEDAVRYRPSVAAGLAAAFGEALPAIPLFEAKAFVAYREGVTGPAPNAGTDGPLWNLEEWRRAGRL